MIKNNAECGGRDTIGTRADALKIWSKTSGHAARVSIPSSVRQQAELLFPSLVGLRGRAWINELFHIAY